MPPPWTDLLFHWTGSILAALALLTGLLAVRGLSPFSILTRPRRLRTRHCPGRLRLLPIPWRRDCWYDLSGVPLARDRLTTCPECGLRSPEAALHHPRRRWKLALLCLLPVQLAAYTIWAIPRMQKEGATGLIPTTALVFLVPRMEFLAPWPGPPPLNTMTLGQRLFYSFDRRSRADGLPQWQWDIALDGCGQALNRTSPTYTSVVESIAHRAAFVGSMRAKRHRDLYWADTTIEIRARPVWPAGATVYGTVFASCGRYDPRFRARVSLWDGSFATIDAESDLSRLVGMDFGTPDRRPELRILGTAESIAAHPTCHVRFDYPENFLAGSTTQILAREWDEPLQIRIVPRVEDILDCREDPRLQAFLAASRRPVLARYTLREGPRYAMDVRPMGLECRPSSQNLAIRFEVLRDGVVVGTGEHFWRACDMEIFRWVDIEPTDPAIALRGPANWTVHIIGDPLLALRDPDATAAWVGQVTIPLDAQTAP